MLDNVDEVGFVGMWCGQTGGREKITCHVDVVFDNAGSDSGARDGFPLNEGDCVAGEEVVL